MHQTLHWQKQLHRFDNHSTCCMAGTSYGLKIREFGVIRVDSYLKPHTLNHWAADVREAPEGSGLWTMRGGGPLCCVRHYNKSWAEVCKHCQWKLTGGVSKLQTKSNEGSCLSSHASQTDFLRGDIFSLKVLKVSTNFQMLIFLSFILCRFC